MLYDFGPQIFEKYDIAMYGPGEDAEDTLDDEATTYMPCAFFSDKDEDGNDMCGADFIVKATKKKGSDWVTYEFSKFKDQSEFLDGDEKKIDAVMDKVYDLNEWTKPEAYPHPSVVQNKLASILGAVKTAQVTPIEADVMESIVEDLDDDTIVADGEQSDEDYIASLV